MYHISIDKEDYANINEKIEMAKETAKTIGYVNEKNMLSIFLGKEIELKNRAREMGWFYDEICKSDFFSIENDKKAPNILYTLSIPEPHAVKYLSRAGRKGDKIEDLLKAIQYIEFEIEEMKEENHEERRTV